MIHAKCITKQSDLWVINGMKMKCGIYIVKHKDEYLYVGCSEKLPQRVARFWNMSQFITSDFRARLNEIRANGEDIVVHLIEYPRDINMLSAAERAIIRHCNPTFNVTRTSYKNGMNGRWKEK